jgi:hypothetical protein
MPVASDVKDQQEQREEEVGHQVDASVGDQPATAEEPVTAALKWYEIVDLPEVGFKAFCRLPNDYQHKDIREKAMAAKARRIRQLKSADSDAFEVLEADLDRIHDTEGAVDNIAHELVMEQFPQDRQQAWLDVADEEEYANLQQDQERFRELEAMDEDKRPGDEWQELVDHLSGFSRKVDARLQEIQKPRLESLVNLGLDGLIERLREKRIQADAARVFMDTYSFWQMFTGTLAVPEGFDPEHIDFDTMPRQKLFKKPEDLREADPYVVSHLQGVFDGLEGALTVMASEGNS